MSYNRTKHLLGRGLSMPRRIVTKSRLTKIAFAFCILALTLSAAHAQLQHRYSFNEGSGTTFADSQGNADGTITGDAALTANGLELNLAGTNRDGLGSILTSATDAVNGLDVASYSGLTLEAWITPQTSTGAPFANDGFSTAIGLGKVNGTDAGLFGEYFILQTHRGDDASRTALSFSDDGSPWDEEEGANGAELNDAQEHHYLATVTSTGGANGMGEIALYVDGLLANVTPLATNAISSISNELAWLGDGYPNDQNFAGTYNEIRVFDDAASLNYAERSFAAGPDTLVSFTEEFDLTARANTVTGEVRIYNTNPSNNVAFNYYTLADDNAGDADALDVSGWTSLDSQGIDAGNVADFNGSGGAVDGADLTQWEGDYAANGDSDADGDGDSDGQDFLTWQRNLGQVAGIGDSWDEAGGSTDAQIAEAFLNGQTSLAPGEFISLGNVYDDAVDTEFGFQYGTPGGIILRGGGVEYVSSFALSGVGSVPEPSTLSAFLIGLVSLFGRRGRFATATIS